MSISSTSVAMRYAKPLFQLSLSQHTLARSVARLQTLHNLIHTHDKLPHILKSPLISTSNKQSILQEILALDTDELLNAFLQLVIRKRRAHLLPSIAQVFLKLYKQKAGIVEAHLTTAVKLPKETTQSFEALVKKIDPNPCQQVQLHCQVDSSILGGFQLEVADRRLDTSLQSALKRLRKNYA